MEHTWNRHVKRLLSERRKGKDRRRYIDPRYRNPAYPQFDDRRLGERRSPVYDEIEAIVKEHPSRKWIAVLGIAVAAFVVWGSVLVNSSVDARLTCRKKADVDSHSILPWFFSFPF